MNLLGRKSKRQKILDEAQEYKDFEKKRIEEILKSLGKYTPALHPLIEVYLDACEVYHIKYLEWKETGFKSTKVHTNKNGAKNEIKHPLAQQVEVWSEKKTKLLNQLGLDMKNKEMDWVDPLASENKKKVAESEKETAVTQQKNRLVQFRQMRGGTQ
ncbi:terminase [Enterococcus thailandicus]|uniref:P27 family phage terminase small subunit n=1 Tax=Enterococcus thailandicus TaxID=417368 RepID=UPI0028902DA4|nr:P27 family phage terminase small subunit [Enterococcus thailandicus]MDT2735288.1 terminase [Enterococcus thailandicus]